MHPRLLVVKDLKKKTNGEECEPCPILTVAYVVRRLGNEFDSPPM